MATRTIDALEMDAVRLYEGMTVTWPLQASEEKLHILEIVPKFPGRYATNNSTVAWIRNGEYFVHPYTREAMRILRGAGLTEAYFYVPFSNGDHPRYEADKWMRLREISRASYIQDFIADCNRYCDEHGIGAISRETLDNCFRMPIEGVHVKHPNWETWIYPLTNSSCFDCTVPDKLGKYDTNNGKVVFVDRDGATYVAKGYKIVDELRAAGFKQEPLHVPFSNGEEIVDSYLRDKWDRIQKF